MAAEQQQQYLDAMGITTWVHRDVVDVALLAEPTPEPLASITEPVAPAPVEIIPPVVEAVEKSPSVADPSKDTSTEDPAPIPDNWPDLQAMVQNCQRCELFQHRHQTVFGVGDTKARLMIIGEAPGEEEDKQGLPFVGPAGQLLTAMLLAIGYKREDVYIANILKCRPPGNRNPHVNEVAACKAYLEQQIALVQPELILSVGGVSAKNLLETDQPVGKLRGTLHQFEDTGIPLIVTYHPAYLIREPAKKAQSWIDLQTVIQQLETST